MKKLGALLVLCLAISACGKEAGAPDPKARPAVTIVVGVVAQDRGNIYSGEVHARYETVLGFRIGGKIIERLVDAGAQVNKGQVLARLDASDTGLKESAAAAQYRLAEEDVKRFRELREKGFVSQSVLDAKETALKAAAAEAGLARNQAAYTALVSDRDGVVAATYAEVGQVVAAGQAVVRVAQHGEREVAIVIPEARYGEVRVGMPAEIKLSASSSDGHTLQGLVREISPAADPVSRTYPARVAIDDGNENLALGQTAQVTLGEAGEVTEFGDEAYLVPLSAIFQQGDKAAVWVVAADRSISLRPVVVAAYRDDGALISNGLVAGERIVSAGVHKLSAGEKVQPIDGGHAR